MAATCLTSKLCGFGDGKIAVVREDAEPVRPRKPVKIGVRRFRAKKEGAAAALVCSGDRFDGVQKIIFVFFLLGCCLRLEGGVPAGEASIATENP